MNLIFQYVRITIVNNELPEYGRKGDGLKSVIVIGGGASGMTAAISAARQGARVTIIDHMDRIGKKILSTGNGKCNYTNQKQGVRYYRGENPAFVLPALRQFGFKETLDVSAKNEKRISDFHNVWKFERRQLYFCLRRQILSKIGK